ncbi:MAG TPA: translocation/assembly module TamB domain-containing protein [Amaricoccus sp.]|nr:translocation/assembly module TamB domain-containing protein [Amaricoccus sp.]
MRRIVALFGLLVIVALGAVAQDASEPDGSDGFLLNLLERRLSTPDRQIRLHGVTGALSSRARIAQISISDQTGRWLEINDVELDWSRLALLRGRVNINRLSAGQINWLRRPVAAPSGPKLPSAEATPFSLPELPVAVDLAELALADVRFEEPVFGRPARISIGGSLNLARGVLESDLAVRRLDGPGGELTLKAGFSNSTRRLEVDLDLHEPQGGLVATLLRIEGEPAIDLTAEGSGPIDDVDVTFALDADGTRVAGGVVALRATDEGLGFDVGFTGEIAPLVPPDFRDFFAGEGTVQVKGISKAGGGLRISTLAVDGPVLRLEGDLETGADGFLRDLTLTGTLGDPAGKPVVLPVPGGRTRLQSAALHVNFGDASRWNGLVVLDRLEAADIAMEDVTLRLGGLAQNLEDPARRNVTIDVEGLATGVWHADPEVARALGGRIDLFADVALPPQAPVQVRQLQLSGNGLSVFSAGAFADGTYTGRNAIRVADLAVLSGLAQRSLGGAIDLRAVGGVTPLSGGFDLTFDGGTTDLSLGVPQLDGLLAGATAVSGRAVRDATGFRTENLRIENPQIALASNGVVSSTRTAIGFDARLNDLAALDPRLSGALTATGRASGNGRPIAVDVSVALPQGTVGGRTVTNLAAGFTGEVNGSDLGGSLDGSGSLDGLLLDLAGDIAVAGDRRSVEGLVVAVGPNRLTGSLAKTGVAPATGRLVLDAPDVASVAALALVEASGALNADITLDAADVGQGATVNASARGLGFGATSVGTLDADARITDALGLPMVQGTLGAADVVAGGIGIATLSAEAEQVDADRMRFTASSRLAIGTLADVSGELARLDGGLAATLATLSLRQPGMAATLTAPATVTVQAGAIELTPLALDFGGGSLTAQGRVADIFDVDVAIRSMPLALANTIRPDLGLAGTIDGAARITGPRAAPDARFDVTGSGLASAATRNAGLPPVAVQARGTTSNGLLDLAASVSGAGGLSAQARGRVPLGPGNLDLTVDLGAFPLALVDQAARGRGLRGAVTGQARITGPLADPAARFSLEAQGVSARVLDDFGLPTLAIGATGDYRARVLTLASGRVSGGGADLSGSGRIPLAGPGLAVRASGSLPLALVNPFLAERSAQVAGILRVNASAQGALPAPRFGGTLSLAGGTFVYPDLNIRLNDVGFEASLEDQTATIGDLRAAVAQGGTVIGEGRVTLDRARGYPADLTTRLNDVRYTDGQFVSTRLNGALTIDGPLVGGGGMLAGTIDLGRTEISIAEGLGASQAALEQVAHVDTPPPVQTTLDRARLGTSEPRPDRAGPGIGLDVRMNAPNQIFVRGRGLDVELGGALRIQGTTTEIRPVGQFDLRRGRLLVLGQRIDFDEGSLQLVGNLDPQIRFVAETQSTDVTAIVTVDGRVSAPRITFSSDPPLPEDEVLARVLFGRSTQNLSAFQVAQLAAAAAELAGGGGPGILSQLRGATGLDDLDIITQEDGSTAVTAGKYLDDNIYVNVQTGTDGVSRAEVRLDLSHSVTARGSVGSDGSSTLGLFYERDY